MLKSKCKKWTSLEERQLGWLAEPAENTAVIYFLGGHMTGMCAGGLDGIFVSTNNKKLWIFAIFQAPQWQGRERVNNVISFMAHSYVCTLWNKQQQQQQLKSNEHEPGRTDCAFNVCICPCMKNMQNYNCCCERDANAISKNWTHIPNDSWPRAFPAAVAPVSIQFCPVKCTYAFT